MEREGDDVPGHLKFAKSPSVVGFSPNSMRDVEVEIVRMLPAVTPGEPARLPKRERKKMLQKLT